jgi:RNA polymerase sigma-70 factor, ECF subfamily
MGAVGFTLSWENRICAVVGQGDERVDSWGNRQPNQTSPVPSEDADLAAGCLAGDLTAYERLYRWQGARMKNLARNLLGSQTDAEDAVQEAFLKIQRGIKSFRGQSAFVTWAFRVLVNTCHDMRRSRMRRKEHSQEKTDADASISEPRAPGAHPSLRMALQRALTTLTRQQREVFLLYEVEGFRHAEIADLLAISEAASKNTLFQAKKNLRTLLEPPRNADAGGSS